MDIRGLHIFIGDIRKCNGNRQLEKARIDEELAKVRKMFGKPKDLSSYDRRKCVCKLLYIYMLGYPIDFGHMEAINLMSSEKYADKHVGYLACSILLDETHPLLTLVTNCVKQDLTRGVQFNQCLALTCIANVMGSDFAEAVGPDVVSILTARDTPPAVRKKAALTTLRLYRRFPESVNPTALVKPLCGMICGADLGVSLCVSSLVLGFLGDDATVAAYEPCVKQVVTALHMLIVTGSYTRDYGYYGVPAPWLQVKLLRILQHYPMPEGEVQTKITNILSTLLKRPVTEPGRAPSRAHALNAILYEAISLTVHYDQVDLLEQAAALLQVFVLEQSDANLRYLGLELLSRLTVCRHSALTFGEAPERVQDAVVSAIRESDVSIRRRALDVLYSMSSGPSAAAVVGELLDYLPSADADVREDVVLKIAILAERFAAELTWYVNVMVSCIAQAGDCVPDDVVQRLCHVVSNAPDVQPRAAEALFDGLQSAKVPDALLLAAADVLGDYGHKLGGERAPLAQISALTSRLLTAKPRTQAAVLTAVAKIAAADGSASVKEAAIACLQTYRGNADPELQCRALEYHAVLTAVPPELARAVLAPADPFPLDVVAAVADKRTKAAAVAADHDVWTSKKVAAGAAAATSTATASSSHAPLAPVAISGNAGGAAAAPAPAAAASGGDLDDIFADPPAAAAPAPAPAAAPAPAPAADDDDIFGGGAPAPAPAPAPAAPASSSKSPLDDDDDIFGGGGGGAPAAPTAFGASASMVRPEPNAHWWTLARVTRAVIHEDADVQIGIVVVPCTPGVGGVGVNMFIGCKKADGLNSVVVGVHPATTPQAQNVQVTVSKPPPPSIPIRQQQQAQLAVAYRGPAGVADLPAISVSWEGLGQPVTFLVPAPYSRSAKADPPASPPAFLQEWQSLQDVIAPTVVPTRLPNGDKLQPLAAALNNASMGALAVPTPDKQCVVCAMSAPTESVGVWVSCLGSCGGQ